MARPRPARPLVPLTAALAVAALWPSASSGQTPGSPLEAGFDSVYFAWDRGDYVEALEGAERVLTAPGGDAWLERLALLTGELYDVRELARDGRAARWSPDGRHAAYEAGAGDGARIRVVAVEAAGVRDVATVEGRGAAFSPDGRHVAFLRVRDTPALTAAREAERQAVASRVGAEVRRLRTEIAGLEAAVARVFVREIETGRETERLTPGLSAFALAYAGDGSLVLVGRPEGQTEGTDLFALAADGPPQTLTSGPGTKGTAVLAAGPGHLVYTVAVAGPPGAVGLEHVVVRDPATGAERRFPGRSPAVSADGSTVAFVAITRELDPAVRRTGARTGADALASGHLNALTVLRVGDGSEPTVVRETTLPLASPALSPSGRRVAYTAVLRDDWDIFVVNADGTGDERLTREIQHDLAPRFLSETLLLGLMGEARHRRSYLYRLDADRLAETAASAVPGDDARGRTQLFHNNTLRTVAPQYEWAPSPDGTRVLVVADRDGNTLSPERGVYLADLTRRVTSDDVVARVRGNLAAERSLRERGQRAFEPIEPAVRAATESVSVGRIYDHAHALYQFDSKFITQPGNALAVEYIAGALRRMGYEPELQWFEPRPGVRSANVVATLRGTAHPDRVYVVSSHFDSVEAGPGADDNTTGTTALLEAARVLAGRPQPATIRFAFLTGEEGGLLGAGEFVRRAVAAGDRISGALNNDMVGWAQSPRLDNTVRYSNDWVRDVQHAAAIQFSDLITYDARYVLSTDAQAFYDAYGDVIGGIGSYPILGNPHYHQSHDTLETVNHRLVAEVCRTTVATVMLMAQRPELLAP
ncbi:MAG TPA: M20/M25/M40 family metallo-hydrolase [Rubricoccaceae bacterium]